MADTQKPFTMDDVSKRKVVKVPLPILTIKCPECGKEDDHANIIRSNSDVSSLGDGETYCDYCEQWFEVVLTH